MSRNLAQISSLCLAIPSILVKYAHTSNCYTARLSKEKGRLCKTVGHDPSPRWQMSLVSCEAQDLMWRRQKGTAGSRPHSPRARKCLYFRGAEVVKPTPFCVQGLYMPEGSSSRAQGAGCHTPTPPSTANPAPIGPGHYIQIKKIELSLFCKPDAVTEFVSPYTEVVCMGLLARSWEARRLGAARSPLQLQVCNAPSCTVSCLTHHKSECWLMPHEKCI